MEDDQTTDENSNRHEEEQTELELQGDLRGVPWAAIITTPAHAAQLQAEGKVVWKEDAYYTVDAATGHVASIEWLASISAPMHGADLTHLEFRILVSLAFRARGKGVAWPCFSTIAKDAQCSRGKAHQAVQSLLMKGAISISPGTGKRSNRYTINSAFGKPKSAVAFPSGDTCVPLRGTEVRKEVLKEDIGLFQETEIEAISAENPATAFVRFLPKHLAEDPRACLALGRFARDRIERRKKMTVSAIRLLSRKVADWTPCQIEIASNTAIERGWLSLFLPKESDMPNPKNATIDETEKDFSAWNKEEE